MESMKSTVTKKSGDEPEGPWGKSQQKMPIHVSGIGY